MQASSQIVRVLQADEAIVQLISRHGEGGRQHACAHFSYYFLMPKTPVRRNRKGNHPRTLCAFGPFRSADHARFIRTSACALGLIEAQTSTPASDAQAHPSVASIGDDRIIDRHADCLPAPAHAPAAVQRMRRPSDASHAA